MTPRYVLWLAGHLPQDSATIADMQGGPKFRPWTQDVHLLALIANLLAGANRQRAGKAMRKPLVEPPKKGRNRSNARVVRVSQINNRRAAAMARAAEEPTGR